MTTSISFEYELPSGTTLNIDAEITPGLPALAPSLGHAGEPEDDPEIEISCMFRGEELCLDGLWFRKHGTTTMINVLDDIREQAWGEYQDEQ